MFTRDRKPQTMFAPDGVHSSAITDHGDDGITISGHGSDTRSFAAQVDRSFDDAISTAHHHEHHVELDDTGAEAAIEGDPGSHGE